MGTSGKFLLACTVTRALFDHLPKFVKYWGGGTPKAFSNPLIAVRFTDKNVRIRLLPVR
jgi:hypothetical protein